MTHKVYIHDGGGAGDIPANQLRCHNGWGHVEIFKKKFPDSKIRVVITSCSPEGARYIKYNPYIDEILELPWVNPNIPWPGLAKHVVGYKRLAQVVKEIMPGVKGEIPPVYLSPEDKDVINSIVGKGEYIFIHPFAGTPERVVFPIEEYPKLIDRIIDDLGYNVVVIGGSYIQTANQGMKDRVKKEEFNYERNGLFNLVNKVNMRIGIYLARKASRWIGTWSCYVWPGYIENTRMVLLMPTERYCGAGVANEIKQKILRIPRGQKDFSSFAEKTIEHLRRNE